MNKQIFFVFYKIFIPKLINNHQDTNINGGLIDLMRELRDVLNQVILTLFYTSAAPSARG